jgi:hypothetical protein
VDSGKGALPKMEAWMGAWNGTFHSFTSNWRELRTIVETLKREEVFFNKLRGRIFFTSQTMKSPTTLTRNFPQKPSHYIS